MLFCPTCSSVLLIDKATSTKFACPRCPYIYYVDGQATLQLQNEPLPVNPVITGEQLQDGAKVKEECPNCNHDMAYCIMFQTRSSDEPMTRFFMCCDCKNRWKNDQ
ncbi:DNA-directed RNA polymerase subunit [Spironucleus salmonicida]|uniref:DNA-directed RNA polymerase subunit n=1 Tax=Spironucleus salmonicida TaxID=348837 RepID=V6LHL5_9EUKA|nr:DNA-directed RNA polymerase subunit [Spironucleus salmonicida]|eukprot:EST44065.1 RNA polymerase III subunit C11 [Spironucleus salmonicida]